MSSLTLTLNFVTGTLRPHIVILEVLLLTTTVAISNNLSYTTKYKEMSSVAKTVGQIPCSVKSFDDVSMILWFKDSSGSPIYSYDARNEKEPRHLTLKNDWGLRLYFRVWPSSKRSPALMIRDLKPTDAGLYRCRVDYRNSPTANSMIRLRVIEPPTHLEIRDTSIFQPISDQQMTSVGHHSNPNLNDITYLGPYVEGQNVTVVCTSYGGKPLPEVIWYENGLMVDASYELTEGNHVTNELSIVNLSKKHSLDLYTCQASNNNETKKISHRINLDVYLAAKHIELDVPDQMTAGAQYNLMCKVVGAYPSVKIEFWKMQKRIGPKYQIKSDADSAISSEILFKPDVEDDEAIILCRAENPWITGKQIEARKRVHVQYTPVAVLRFGSSKRGNFSEGESVLFECHVKSNPDLREITWFHGETPLRDDMTSGIVINGFTLLLRHLTHLSGGSYTCEATNDVGKGTSNSVNILVNIAPRCISEPGSGGLERMIPLAVGETHHLECNVLAWPSDLNFYWTLNRSKTVLPIPSTGNRDMKALTAATTTTTTTTTTTSTSSPSSTSLPTTIVPPRDISINYNEPSPHIPPNISYTSNSNNSASSTLLDLESVNNTNDPVTPTAPVNVDDPQDNCSGSEESTNSNCAHSSLSSHRNETNVISFDIETDSNGTGESGESSSSRDRREIGAGSGKGDASVSEKLFHHYAVIPYKIFSEQDYGIVSCWAENSFAKQLHPCIFHIVLPDESNRDQHKLVEDELGEEESSQYSDERVTNFKTKKRKGKELQLEKVDSGQHKLEPLWYGIEGNSLGRTIILMGLLVFVGMLSSGCFWAWRRKVSRPSESPASDATQQDQDPATHPPLMEKMNVLPSSSIHNDGKAAHFNPDIRIVDPEACSRSNRPRNFYIDIDFLACCSFPYQCCSSRSDKDIPCTDYELEEKEFTRENENCRN